MKFADLSDDDWDAADAAWDKIHGQQKQAKKSPEDDDDDEDDEEDDARYSS